MSPQILDDKETFILRHVNKSTFSFIKIVNKLGAYLTGGAAILLVFLILFESSKFYTLYQSVVYCFIAGLVFLIITNIVGFELFWKPSIVKFAESGINFVKLKNTQSVIFHIPKQNGVSIDMWKPVSFRSSSKFIIFNTPDGEKVPFIYGKEFAYIKNTSSISFIERFENFRMNLKNAGIDITAMDKFLYKESRETKIILISLGILMVLFVLMRFYE